LSLWADAASVSCACASGLLVPASLYALATLDSAFAGYREAAGRSALINKGAYYRRAMLRGALWGQAAVAVALAVFAALYFLTDDRAAFVSALLAAGRRMLAVYVPYTAVVLAAFAVRAVPSVDVRSLTSTLVFGPFVFVRPLVVAAGVAWGMLAARRADASLLLLVVLALMLLIERFLARLRRGRT
jgi:hypothetical protein